MSNEELNRRTRFFAENGLPYSDKVWRLLAEAWEQGYQCHREGLQRHNPYQPLVAFSDPPAEPQGAPPCTCGAYNEPDYSDGDHSLDCLRAKPQGAPRHPCGCPIEYPCDCPPPT